MAERRKLRISTEGKARKPAPGGGTSKDKEFNPDDDAIKAMLPKGIARAFVNSKLHEQRVRASGLTPPDDYEGDMPKLPEDVGSMSHDELSQLLIDFQSALSTATWQASQAYIRADIMDDIADYLSDNVVLKSDQSNEQKRKAEANIDERVSTLR